MFTAESSPESHGQEEWFTHHPQGNRSHGPETTTLFGIDPSIDWVCTNRLFSRCTSRPKHPEITPALSTQPGVHKDWCISGMSSQVSSGVQAWRRVCYYVEAWRAVSHTQYFRYSHRFFAMASLTLVSGSSASSGNQIPPASPALFSSPRARRRLGLQETRNRIMTALIIHSGIRQAWIHQVTNVSDDPMLGRATQRDRSRSRERHPSPRPRSPPRTSPSDIDVEEDAGMRRDRTRRPRGKNGSLLRPKKTETNNPDSTSARNGSPRTLQPSRRRIFW